MKRNNIKKALPILQAIAEGKSIQWRDSGNYHSKYKDINIEEMNEYQIINYPEDYRIKPEPKYCPFKDAEECWQEMLKHQPFGWVKSTLFKDLDLVKRVTTLYVEINRDIIDYKDVLEKFTFADGTPFGIIDKE